MVLRCEDGSRWNILKKSIHQPEAVDLCWVHEAGVLKPGYKGRTVDPDKIRIHHYWARTEDFCLSYRGRLDFEEQNRVEDRTMKRYLPALKRKMAQWK